jgi:hypothetical protein
LASSTSTANSGIRPTVGDSKADRWHLQIANGWAVQDNFYINNRQCGRMLVRICCKSMCLSGQLGPRRGGCPTKMVARRHAAWATRLYPTSTRGACTKVRGMRVAGTLGGMSVHAGSHPPGPGTKHNTRHPSSAFSGNPSSETGSSTSM